VRRSDDEVPSRTVDGAGRAAVIALGVMGEQGADTLTEAGRLGSGGAGGRMSVEELRIATPCGFFR
jgi:hypothetical protein